MPITQADLVCATHCETCPTASSCLHGTRKSPGTMNNGLPWSKARQPIVSVYLLGTTGTLLGFQTLGGSAHPEPSGADSKSKPYDQAG